MIHIENITVNIQVPSPESGPTSALGDALLHAMAESLFSEQTEELGIEEEVQPPPPTNPPRMDALQQCAAAWMAVCRALYEVRPSWMEEPGSAQENAEKAIRAMAKAR